MKIEKVDQKNAASLAQLVGLPVHGDLDRGFLHFHNVNNRKLQVYPGDTVTYSTSQKAWISG